MFNPERAPDNSWMDDFIESEEAKKSGQNEKRKIFEIYEKSKKNTTELQRDVEEVQTAKYGTYLIEIMRITENNPEIFGALNSFIDGLREQSLIMNKGGRAYKSQQEELAKFLEQVSLALMNNVNKKDDRGNPTKPDIRIDFSKWEQAEE